VRRATRTPFGTFAQVSVCPTCDGAGEVIEEKCDVCAGSGRRQETKKLKITIPAGVDNGMKLRVAREGDAGLKGGPPGDLFVYLTVETDTEFQREGNDIKSNISISYIQAILGCTIKVNTVDGQEDLTIPAGTQPNTVLILENKGVPKLGNPVSRGDHRITVKISIPTRVTGEERDLLEKLAKVRGETVGKGGIEGFLGNIFHK
jgi:molecular chaperone DnaJ